MIIQSLEIRKMYDSERIYLNGEPLAHFIWNHYNPNNLKRKGYHVHHKDENPMNDHISNLELLTKEKHMSLHGSKKIQELNPFYGKNHTEQTKKVIGLKSKGRIDGKKNPMYDSKRFGELNPFYGRKHSKEFIEKITGRVLSEETKRKISDKAKGRKRQNVSNETRKKLSEALKQNWAKKKLGL